MGSMNEEMTGMKKRMISMALLLSTVVWMAGCGHEANVPAASDIQSVEQESESGEETQMSEQEGTGAAETQEETAESEADYLGIIRDHEQTTSTEGCDTFTQMVDTTLTDGQGYTNVKLGGEDVLVVAGSTFGGYEQDAAIDAEIFRYADDGSIEYLGIVQSGGSATPLAVKDGMIYTAGHHYIGKHTITNGALVTVEEAWETFDSEGNAACHYSSDDGGDYADFDSDKAKEIFDELFAEYNEADILGFDTISR